MASALKKIQDKVEAEKQAKVVSQLVDRLGEIKAEKADLEVKEREIVEELKTRGVGLYSGSLFEANIFSQHRSNTDHAAVYAQAKVPQKIIDKHTEHKDILVCKVGARK